MGNTIIDQDYPYDILHRGSQDESRHNKRVNDAVKKQLRDVISQQDIISGQGNKKVRVRLKYLDQYRFRHSKDSYKEIGRDQFDELEEGEVISQPTPAGEGDPNKAGNDDGDEVYEVEYTIDELTEILLNELKLPRLDERKKNEIVSEVVEWNDIRKESGVRSLIDKKRTLRANIKRRARIGSENEPIINDDLRFRTYNITKEKHSNAVVFLMMDRSGSMWKEKIYAVKALYFWIVQFLKLRYNKVEIKFIAHDYNARELQEKEFFTISDSGGTRVSSAYELCYEMIKHNYPQSKWNIYCFHASDGDSWSDEKEAVALADDIIKVLGATLFAYTEINIDNERDTKSDLWKTFSNMSKSNDKILMGEIRGMEDVLPVIEFFLRYSTRVKHAGVHKNG